MPYELESRLVIGLASSALFDLAESDAVFRAKGEDHYRLYQDQKIDDRLEPGIAFHRRHHEQHAREGGPDDGDERDHDRQHALRRHDR